MSKGRLEAFSDGVIAIIITIMVLEIKVAHVGTSHDSPHTAPSLADLRAIWPVFLSYVLSFVYIGIYWNNHHHMLHATKRVGGGVLWANLHLLFWLSLVPFVTGWMGENQFAPVPTAVYGVVLLLSAIAYTILQYRIIGLHEKNEPLPRAVARDRKGRISLALYVIGIPVSLWVPWIGCAIYALVAVMWFIPDSRIEHELESTKVSA